MVNETSYSLTEPPPYIPQPIHCLLPIIITHDQPYLSYCFTLVAECRWQIDRLHLSVCRWRGLHCTKRVPTRFLQVFCVDSSWFQQVPDWYPSPSCSTWHTTFCYICQLSGQRKVVMLGEDHSRYQSCYYESVDEEGDSFCVSNF